MFAAVYGKHFTHKYYDIINEKLRKEINIKECALIMNQIC